MTDYPGWCAFLDEEMPHPRPGVEPSYIIAAAMLDPVDCEDAGWRIAKLAGKRPTFHWRDAEPPQRAIAVETVAELPALLLVVVSSPMRSHNQERPRRKALSRLMYELDQREVTTIQIESRTRPLNQRDQRTINVAKSHGVLSRDVYVEHVYAEDEPLVWIPDIVAGAFGSDEEYLRPLKPLVETERVPTD